MINRRHFLGRSWRRQHPVPALAFGFGLVLAGTAAFPAPVTAQTASDEAITAGWTPPATAWGDTDLQGIWDYRTLTPLQRPEEFADRTVASAEEAAEYEVRANAVRDARTTVHAVWWLDYGRDRPADDVRLWSGVARGHWEGDTLVIVSTHFSSQAAPRGATAGLRLEERLTRVGPKTISYSATLTDPGTWTQPWTFAMPMTRTDQPPYEYACHEGNYGLRNILHNARCAEDPDYLSKLPSPTPR